MRDTRCQLNNGCGDVVAGPQTLTAWSSQLRYFDGVSPWQVAQPLHDALDLIVWQDRVLVVVMCVFRSEKGAEKQR